MYFLFTRDKIEFCYGVTSHYSLSTVLNSLHLTLLPMLRIKRNQFSAFPA